MLPCVNYDLIIATAGFNNFLEQRLIYLMGRTGVSFPKFLLSQVIF